MLRKLHIESSLSRIWRHNELHDCGALTAFRKSRDCGNGKPYTRKENDARNKSLLSKLKSKGYGVTSLKGKYPEGGTVGKEESFFVVDLQDAGRLEKDLINLGAEFEQDSVLFVPKGAIQGKATAYLIGTNRCQDNFLDFGQTMPFEKGKLGYTSPIYTSFVNGRPFIFESVNREINDPQNGMGILAMHKTAEKHWTELVR